jgi:hypothetical protein
VKHMPPPYPEGVEPRSKPMQVLCLGPSRTATMSTWLALKKLGYTSYHMMESSLNLQNQHHTLWANALKAKQQGRVLQLEDLDQMLWRYDAVTDIPCVLFVDELLRLYPDAKVVLQKRDPEKWARSIMESFRHVLSGWRWVWLRAFDKVYCSQVGGFCIC